MYEFKLPDVGEGILQAEILKWLVKVGDTVALDQIILEIETDKAIVEIPSPVAGTIAEIRAEAGSMASVGEVLVVLQPVESPHTPVLTNQLLSEARQDPNGSHQKSEDKSPVIAGSGKRILAAPAVRKMALELGINLTQVPGSGQAGRVLPSDLRRYVSEHEVASERPEARSDVVEHAAVAKFATPTHSALSEAVAQVPVVAPSTAALSPEQHGQELAEELALRGLRRRIAERMEQAWQIPHVTIFDEVEATKLVALRQHLKAEAERKGIRLTYLPFIIKATVQVLRDLPYFNATVDMERQKIFIRRYYHLGIATAVPEGLLVPVLRHADQKNLLQIGAELNRLSVLAQQRKLGQGELSGSTFTITNFGSFDGHQGTPIINPPEVAILGCGRIKEQPVAVQGQVEVRPVLPLALSFDHRLIDGAAAAQFLGRLKALLNDPNLLLLELV